MLFVPTCHHSFNWVPWLESQKKKKKEKGKQLQERVEVFNESSEGETTQELWGMNKYKRVSEQNDSNGFPKTHDVAPYSIVFSIYWLLFRVSR